MRILARMIGWAALAALGLSSGCGNNGPANPPTVIDAIPDFVNFTDIGQQITVVTSENTSAPASVVLWIFTSSDTTVATVAPTGGAVPTQGYAAVTAVGVGHCAIHVELRFEGTSQGSEKLDVPVTVAVPSPLNGTWTGDVSLQPDSCAGSTTSYGETVVVDVDSAGVGTLTVTDTPGFVRQYQITIPPGGEFTASGTFDFEGTHVPGQIVVSVIDSHHLDFQETTHWGPCSNRYAGVLSR